MWISSDWHESQQWQLTTNNSVVASDPLQQKHQPKQHIPSHSTITRGSEPEFKSIVTATCQHLWIFKYNTIYAKKKPQNLKKKVQERAVPDLTIK